MKEEPVSNLECGSQVTVVHLMTLRSSGKVVFVLLMVIRHVVLKKCGPSDDCAASICDPSQECTASPTCP